MCLSILNEEKAWKPSITVKQILVGVQELLDNPNNADAAQDAAYRLYKRSGTEYAKRVRIEASKYMEASVPTLPAGEPVPWAATTTSSSSDEESTRAQSVERGGRGAVCRVYA